MSADCWQYNMNECPLCGYKTRAGRFIGLSFHSSLFTDLEMLCWEFVRLQTARAPRTISPLSVSALPPTADIHPVCLCTAAVGQSLMSSLTWCCGRWQGSCWWWHPDGHLFDNAVETGKASRCEISANDPVCLRLLQIRRCHLGPVCRMDSCDRASVDLLWPRWWV